MTILVVLLWVKANNLFLSFCGDIKYITAGVLLQAGSVRMLLLLQAEHKRNVEKGGRELQCAATLPEIHSCMCVCLLPASL